MRTDAFQQRLQAAVLGRCRWPGCEYAAERIDQVVPLCSTMGGWHAEKVDETAALEPWDFEQLLHDTILSFGFQSAGRCAMPGCYSTSVSPPQRVTGFGGGQMWWPIRSWCSRHGGMLNVSTPASGRSATITGLLRLVVADVEDVLTSSERLWGWTRDHLLMVDDTRGTDTRVHDRRVLTLVLTRLPEVRVGDLVRDWFGHSHDGFRRLRRKAEELLATDHETRAAVAELVHAVMTGPERGA
jgi:hypothetical protein